MNWWLATLESLGILTHDQAKHIAENIKNSIHKDNYDEALQELKSILNVEHFKGLPIVTKLETDIEDLKSRTSELENKPEVKDVSEDLQKLTEKVSKINTQKETTTK